MAMAAEKSISDKIDDTIDGVLMFVLRYLRTVAGITRRPHRARRLLNSSTDRNSGIVKPLTFLVIGAFLFALLIDVYPRGFAGLLDFIWLVDEIKANIRARWKEAISVTDLVTAGLPTVLVVALLGAVSGRVFFTTNDDRMRWFHLTCYAFGYQMAVIFLVFSLDSIAAGIGIVLPGSPVGISEDVASAISLGVLTAVVLIALFVPLVLLGSGLSESWPRRTLRSVTVSWAGAIVYWALVQYLYAGVASVIPELNQRYFPNAEPGLVVYEVRRDDEPGAFSFVLAIDNPSAEDAILEIDASDLTIDLARSPGDANRERWWPAHGLWQDTGTPHDRTIRVVAQGRHKTLVELHAQFSGWREACGSLVTGLRRDRDDPQFEGSLLNLYLIVNSGFRDRAQQAKAETMLDGYDESDCSTLLASDPPAVKP